MKRMTRWGIGPSVVGPVLVVAAVAAAVTWRWPQWFSLRFAPYPLLAAVGVVMIAVALPIFISAFRAIDQAFPAGKLVTDGPYAICRNPIYAIWIILILPAIALLCNSWLMLSVPLVMYVATRLRIHHEEAYLEERFGQEYLDYRRRTNAIFPTIRRRRT